MFPILFSIGTFHIATYGVFVAAGYLAGVLYLKAHLKEMKISEDQFWKLIYLLFLGALLGGKLLFLILHNQDMRGLWEAIRGFRYGFVFYGGFLGAAGLGWRYVHRQNLDFWSCADFAGPALALGHAIGRLGCFAAGCCYGRETSLPWGISFSDPNCLVENSFLGLPLHPTQLYEALGNFGIFLFLHFSVKRFRIISQPGDVFRLYILLYALLRFLIEFVRGDSRGGTLLGLSISQGVALILIFAILYLKFSHRLPSFLRSGESR
ncbi:MAG: prolipoprotein diacylglyceryl transferase [Elusimicrobia bacterium]|nr:prolipoprotein diacylglyceryl transferase [Elusimicrobiota bacterium]